MKTDIDMLLMVEKGIRGEICHAIDQYSEPKNKYMEDYVKNKESSYFKYWDVKIYMVGQRRKSFQQINFNGSKILLK